LNFLQIKGKVLFKGDVIAKNAKIRWFDLKYLFSKNHKARKAQIYMKASWYDAK
jgi:hypothetical protein